MRTIMILAVLSIFSLTTVYSEDGLTQGPQFRSYINGISCGQIVEGVDNEEARKAYVLMVSSFISGANYAKSRDSKIDLNGMLLLTEQFCRQNPEISVLTAMIFLDKSIDKRNSIEKR